MGRDSGDSARLLARLAGDRGAGPAGWSDGDRVPVRAAPWPADADPDPFPPGTGGVVAGGAGDAAGGAGTADAADGGRPGGGGRRGRHVDAAAARRGPAWRVAGVPPGLAVLVLLVAVVGVLLLGRGGGSQEVLVGPAGAAGVGAVGAGAQGGATDGASQDPAGPGGGVVGDVVPGVPATTGPVPTAGPAAAGPAPGAAAATGPGPGDGPLLVHVDGAVERPGVVELPPGSRVGDAVQAAGGATDEADTRLVNLARPLSDGELVVVPRPGEQVPAQAVPGAADTAPGAADAAPGAGPATGPGPGAAPGGGPVDLNSADAAALDELPGIGPVLAERIVTWREESGPFATVDDLTAVSGIGPAVLSDIRDLVTV